MNLFIFSSKMKNRTKNSISVMLFCVTFVSLFAAGSNFAKGKLIGSYLEIDSELWSFLDRGMYVDYGLGANSLSHDIFYHGWGESVKYAQKADVLILGNSRTLCGFSSEIMREFAQENNIRFYNMSFGFGESLTFPEYIMEKYGLKPKIVIVNANQFFIKEASDYGGKLLKRSSWERFRNFLDDYIKYAHFRTFRKYMPHFLPDFRIVGDYAYIRSEVDGAWTILNLQKPSVALRDYTTPTQAEDYDLQLAKQFNSYVKSWGGTLVLTYVPYPGADVASIRRFARELDVDFIYPEIQDLKVFDASHLDDASARKFTIAFFKTFEGLMRDVYRKSE